MSGINYNFHKQEASTLGTYVDSDGMVKRDTETRSFNPKQGLSLKFNEKHKHYEEQKSLYRKYRKQGMSNGEIRKRPDVDKNSIARIIRELGTGEHW